MEMILRSTWGSGPPAPCSRVPGSSSVRGYPLRPSELLLLCMPSPSSSPSDWLFWVGKKEELEENSKMNQYGSYTAFLTDDKRAPCLGGRELQERNYQTQHSLVHSLTYLYKVADDEGDDGAGDEDYGEGDNGLPGTKLISPS